MFLKVSRLATDIPKLPRPEADKDDLQDDQNKTRSLRQNFPAPGPGFRTANPKLELESHHAPEIDAVRTAICHKG
jgi:hypothetical protein